MVRVRFTEQKMECEGAVGESLLDIALRNDIALDHACGGVCACSTCHVKVKVGTQALSEATEDEEDQLDDARDVGLDSRLGCQARIVADLDTPIEIAVPEWNVNMVQEGH